MKKLIRKWLGIDQDLQKTHKHIDNWAGVIRDNENKARDLEQKLLGLEIDQGDLSRESSNHVFSISRIDQELVRLRLENKSLFESVNQMNEIINKYNLHNEQKDS